MIHFFTITISVSCRLHEGRKHSVLTVFMQKVIHNVGFLKEMVCAFDVKMV